MPYWAGAPRWSRRSRPRSRGGTAPLLQERDDLVDEGVDAVGVDVDGEREAVAGAGLEPLLHVVGDVGGGAGDDRVVVDDAVGEDVAQGPALTGDLEGARGARVARARRGPRRAARGQRLVELAGRQRRPSIAPR